jgi:hypothetical protein
MSLLSSQGYFLSKIQLPTHVRERVLARDWVELDRAMRVETLPGGIVFHDLQKYAKFSEIEFIISIRSSLEFPDEDGIWHDDGSRLLAFSLSLTHDPQSIIGGKLQIRKRDGTSPQVREILTPPFGTMIVFATGQSGYEHKINLVSAGERIIIAGWCT